MNNQGQPGQPNPMAGQAVPGARQPPMYRPEMMRNLPILNDEEKAKYERGLRQLWNHYETHPEESAQHQDAKKKIQDFTKMLLNKLQQRRMQVQQQQQQQQAQQQQAAQQQQQSQPAQPPAPVQPAQPAQPQPQPQQQQQQQPAAAANQGTTGGVTVKTEPKTENNNPSATAEPAQTPTPAPASVPTPTAPQQAPQQAPQTTQFPDHILAHIRQMTFNPPQGILDKGQESAVRWSNDYKAKYLRALMQMDQQGNQMKRIDVHIKNQQEKGVLGADEQKQLQIRRDHAQKIRLFLPVPPTQTLQSKLPIPKQLPEKATAVPQPVAMAGGAGAGRPTYTGGGGIAGGVMGQPAMAKIPAYVHEAEGDHVLSKKKLDELVRQVCGGNAEGQEINMLTPEVEESVLAMADSFVDSVLETACRNAKERGSKVLEIRDIQLVLERTYNIRVPGYSSDELRTVRKIQPSTAWITKMSAIQAAKVTSGKGEKRAHAKRASAKDVQSNRGEDGDADIDTSPAKSKTQAPKPRSRKNPASSAKTALDQAQAPAQATNPYMLPYAPSDGGQNSGSTVASRVEINFVKK
ncbi:transcription initiation factor TFIID subunit 12 [Colletotrichum higginsianum]|nr:transcription initiation factor TFIID subunit 12 [Colletotrichum higginsianum]